jgi:hypothetical protein
MKIIHLNGFSEEEKKGFKEIIHSNVITSMKALLEAAQHFKYEIADTNKVENPHTLSFSFSLSLMNLCSEDTISNFVFWYSLQLNV